jgi:hypothetical protein
MMDTELTGNTFQMRLDVVERELAQLRSKKFHDDQKTEERLQTLECDCKQIKCELGYASFNKTIESMNNIYFRNLKESLMLNEFEVEKHFLHKQFNDSDTMNAIGGCRNVSSLAYAFYFTHYKLMTPKFVDGFLVNVEGNDLRLVDGRNASRSGLVGQTTMKYYRLNFARNACVWKHDATFDGSCIDKAIEWYRHSVIEVVIADGSSVVVDWNVGQFENLEDGQFMFCMNV